MKKYYIALGLVVVIILGSAVGAYFFFIQKKIQPVTNTPAEDINAVGTHRLTEDQKKTLGVSANVDATLEVIATNTSPGAVVKVLNVATDPNAPIDSDGDGLSDQDEAKYKTDPHNIDTDGDLVTDNAEIKACLDPLKPDTLGNGKGDFANLRAHPEGFCKKN